MYDFQPTRQYLLKLSVPAGHGRELEATQSLPTMTPVTLAFKPYFTKLFWARESTEYLILTEILQQQKVVALDRQFPGIVPRDVIIQAGVTLAYAAKTWQVKDLGAYNLAVLEPFELGYKLGVLDLADWTSWRDRYPVFPGKKKARGLLTMARHGHAEALLKLFESLAGLDPDQAIRTLRPHLTEQAERALQAQGILCQEI